VVAVTKPLTVSFIAGELGPWRILRSEAVAGPALPLAERLSVSPGEPEGAVTWRLDGVTSNSRYTTRRESDALTSLQESLGRPAASMAALIPIRKSAGWWAMAQDEKRAIFEERSRHITIGMDYLPQIARRLHHCRELGGPFDFLTWFEFPPAAAADFDHMLSRLRATEEWRHVEAEIDIRLIRD
jgi:chlorite dismutase